MNLLHIDSSVLGQHSVSRKLSADIVKHLTAQYAAVNVTYHDLASDAALHLSGAHLAAFQGAEVIDPTLKADLAAGSSYLQEVLASDLIVIGAPMYNFSVSSLLKAWIDRIVIAGKTFKYGENGPVGLVSTGKKVYIASSRGGVYTSGSFATFDHQEAYLKDILSLIGITDITIVRAEGLNFGDEARNASITKATSDIAALS